MDSVTDRSYYHFDLPEDRIAQHPPAKRGMSRLLVLDGKTGACRHHMFSELPDLLEPGDCLVINNTRVIPARLIGERTDSGAPVEILLLEKREGNDWVAMVRPGRKVRPGHRIRFKDGLMEAEILDILSGGHRLVRFHYEGSWDDLLEQIGLMPLPPYIHETLEDKERYQTVYAIQSGSAAAPTAGLHFTDDLLAALRRRGVVIAELTLHVGPGTFQPVKETDIRKHNMHREYYDLSPDCARTINEARQRGHRVIAVGTTSCRVMETLADANGCMQAGTGWTEIFIYPGYHFKSVDSLITNFHLPESTLIMLVSALAGRDHIMTAYQEAIQEKYRFFSFGDAMLISGKDHS